MSLFRLLQRLDFVTFGLETALLPSTLVQILQLLLQQLFEIIKISFEIHNSYYVIMVEMFYFITIIFISILNGDHLNYNYWYYFLFNLIDRYFSISKNSDFFFFFFSKNPKFYFSSIFQFSIFPNFYIFFFFVFSSKIKIILFLLLIEFMEMVMNVV